MKMREDNIIKQTRHSKVIIQTKQLTLAHRRLIKDLEELQRDPIPICGVSACPLQTNLFIWHANLRGPKKTKYQDGVYHLQIKFPESYPSHPPVIKSLGYLVHPLVFGNYLCLDMLSLFPKASSKQFPYEWASIYTVKSILYQLQGFLLNENNLTEAKDAYSVNNAELFRCTECKHKGTEIWPRFRQNDTKRSQYQLKQISKIRQIQQLRCFYTKLGYDQNQIGLGINITKIPRTGLIKDAIIYQDFISIKAFVKQSVNRTVRNQKITHWLPVYFGNCDNIDKYLHFLKKSLSMIMTNSTKYFKEQFILQVLPKLLINLVFQIMDRKKYPSIKLIRIFSQIHMTFLIALKQYPSLIAIILQRFRKFKSDQNERTKDNTPNLGVILTLLTVIDNFQFSDMIQLYFEEQLDRQVFWMMKAVPELVSEELADKADSVRNQLAFNCQKTSFYITCFFKLFLQHCSLKKSKQQILSEYVQNFGRFKILEQNAFQNEVFDIFKNIKSFSDYFRYVGLPDKTKQQINLLLKEAISNSQRKKYHNREEILEWQEKMKLKKKLKNQQIQTNNIKITNIKQQIATYFQNVPSYSSFITVTSKSNHKEGAEEVSMMYDEKQSCDKDWRELCLARWPWIKQCLLSDHTLTADHISQLALELYHHGSVSVEERLYTLQKQYQGKYSNMEKPSIKKPTITWKMLFLRLDLEDYLKYIDVSQNFPLFYQKLFVCSQNKVNTLMIPLIQIKNLKSGYYYLTAILTKLIHLKHLEISCSPNSSVMLQQKMVKAIRKGFHNFYLAMGKLQILAFNKIRSNTDFAELLFKKPYYNQSIISFRINSSNIFFDQRSIKFFAGHNFPQLQQIIITNSSLNQSKSKTLADMLVKLKKLKIFKMNGQQNLRKGLSLIVSNLAFNSSLRLLDISNNSIFKGQINEDMRIIKEIIQNLGKTIKINSNIEFMLLSNIPHLNTYLNQQFWIMLGESISLIELDLSSTTPNQNLNQNCHCIGMAIAFNAKKKGSLAYLNISGSIGGALATSSLYQGMNINLYDEQAWYGSPIKLQGMISENYQKKFYNNLVALNLSHSNNLDTQFSIKEYESLIEPEVPKFAKLMANSKNLREINLCKSGFTKSVTQIFVISDSIRTNAANLKSLVLSRNNLGLQGAYSLARSLERWKQIQILDISSTKIGVQGFVKISQSLKSTTTLRYLNLFNNKIGFEGAKSIAQNIFSSQSNLQFVELGYNLLRSKGLNIIIHSIINNKLSRVKILGLRFNFLTNYCILSNINKICKSDSALKELYLRNNLLDDFGLNEIKQILLSYGRNISLDVLQKLTFTETQKASKTIWIHPIHSLQVNQLRQFFQVEHKCGVILDVRIKKGKKYHNKKGQNKFCFIQFASEQSVKMALSIAANKLSQIRKVKFRIYRSGTGTFVYHKRSSKQIKIQQARKAITPLPLPLPRANYKKIQAVSPNPEKNNKDNEKCQQRYLDQIKPISPWRYRTKILVKILLIGLPIFFIDYYFFHSKLSSIFHSNKSSAPHEINSQI